MARTEGWPAVLQLAGLSLAGRPDVSGYVRDFAATHRFVLDFITEEVLGRLEPDVSEFLLQTSVLDRLTGPLCDALTGGTDGQAMLERLERANLILVPLDDERRWYRYHLLFADLLRARLGVEHPAEPTGLHLRAADWYERHGFAREAIEHALRSGDPRRARDLIAKASADLIHHAEFATLRGWFDDLPVEVVHSASAIASATDAPIRWADPGHQPSHDSGRGRRSCAMRRVRVWNPLRHREPLSPQAPPAGHRVVAIAKMRSKVGPVRWPGVRDGGARRSGPNGTIGRCWGPLRVRCHNGRMR